MVIVLLSACTSKSTEILQEAAPEGADSESVFLPVVEGESQEAMESIPMETESITTESVEAEPMIVTRVLTSDPNSLDPHGAISAGQNVVLPFLLDTLVYRDEHNKYHPYLAESWQVLEDGLVYQFELKSSVKFHDGSDLNADAVRFNFQRIKDASGISPLAGSFAIIESMEVVDELTLRITLTAPSATFLGTISTPYAGIVSPTAVEVWGAEFGQHLVGSGAYQLDNWETGLFISLVKNENYQWAPQPIKNQGAPYIDELIFKIIPDATMQYNAFLSGEVDILFINDPEQVKTFQQVPEAVVEPITLNSLIYIGFNCTQAPFDQVAMRKVIAHAIDKDMLVELALGGVGSAAHTLIVPTLAGYDESLEALDPTYDPALAQSILREEGYQQEGNGTWTKNGQPLALELLISTRSPNEALATVVQAQLKEIGIPVTINALDSGAARTAATSGDYQFSIWRYDWNDPDILNMYLSTEMIGRTNRQFYSNPDLDQILADGETQLDEVAREQLYVQAQQILMQDLPWVPLYVPLDFVVMRNTIQDYQIGSMGRIVLNDAVVKK
jgi:peptide/nickel transport system substrate-binding protein